MEEVHLRNMNNMVDKAYEFQHDPACFKYNSTGRTEEEGNVCNRSYCISLWFLQKPFLFHLNGPRQNI